MSTQFEDTVIKKFDEMETRFERIDRKFEMMDGRFEKIDSKLDVLTQSVHRLEVLHEETADKIDTIVEIVGAQRDHMTKLATKEDITEVRTGISTIQKAVKATNKDLKGKLFFQPAQAA